MATRRKARVRRVWSMTLVMLCLAVLAPACEEVDPEQELLRERARFMPELLSWAEREDGRVVANVRVTGPVRTELERLTVELRRFRADGSVIASEWVTLDVSEMVMGTALETTLFLEPAAESPDSLGLLLHPQPTEDQRVHLEELAGLR